MSSPLERDREFVGDWVGYSFNKKSRIVKESDCYAKVDGERSAGKNNKPAKESDSYANVDKSRKFDRPYFNRTNLNSTSKGNNS